MGTRSVRVSYEEWDMDELSEATGLPPERIQAIYPRYTAIIMMNHNMPRRDRIDFLIGQYNSYGDIKSFDALMIIMVYLLVQNISVEKQIDQNNRGYITQEELMNYIANQAA
ncbi:unnamed protein product [Rotaria sordida]|uniref:EF-hand domain-containing protein n=1 Tax=Rotaria sordida TaxID=392033 RepID=A0A819CPX5_9BILA|nr:unnamed protein product [Rotaria sordida]CAF1004591.1 unnamed protein product [Rotaria sordida]CAF3815619.1 unnamed protein product [Rotaria sordida]CAF4134566.1 unnamed protein product [Rotaria sordida]